jgi:uncharacterized membrane protein
MKQREIKIDQLLMPVFLLSVLSVGLLLARVIATGSTDLWYLNWNLILAWLPLVFVWGLLIYLQKNRWATWQGVSLTFLWFIFLPNSFYLVTDFVHLQPAVGVSLLFDIVLFMSYALTGLLLGYLSVYLIQERMMKTFPKKYINIFLSLAFLLSGYAIYLGRYLGWNSWDIASNPFGIALDTIDRLIYPQQYGSTFTTTILLAVFLGVTYMSFYYSVKLVRSIK